jgi:hypothetical protein
MYRTISLILAAGLMALAQPEIRQEKLQFPGGQPSVTLKGTLKGDQSVDYLLSSAEGGRWAVDLRAGGSTYFNITAPGEDSALFVGSAEGRKFEGALPKAGEYTVRVYQMRSAARRGAAANYSITFRPLAGGVAAAGEAGPAKFNAKGVTKCSSDGAGFGTECEFRVVRKPNGAAEIWLAKPAAQGKFRVLYFDKGEFTTNDGSRIDTQKQSDTWYVTANGNEYYMIPDAMITGG